MMKRDLKPLFRMLRYLRPYRKATIFIAVLSIVGMFFGLLNPFLAKLLVDKAFMKHSYVTFIVLFLIGGIIYVLNGLINSAKDHWERKLKLRVRFDFNIELFRHLEKLPLDYFKDRSQGEHLHIFIGEVDGVANFIVSTLPTVVMLAVRVVSTFTIIFFLNWQIAALTMALSPAFYLSSRYFTQRRLKLSEEKYGGYDRLFKWLAEFFSKINLVKAFATEVRESKRYLKKLLFNMRSDIQSSKLELTGDFTNDVISRFLIGLITFWAGFQVVRGRMTLGTLGAITLYVGQLMGAHTSIARFYDSLAIALMSYRRIMTILDTQPQIAESGSPKSAAFKGGGIEFSNVSFGYRREEPVINRLGFKIPDNAHVAIAGPSGCGKTTILNLMLRLYDSWEGDILVGGSNIKDFKNRPLKEIFGIALQETFLWNDTIANNIRYARPYASEEDVLWAARICLIDRFTDELPDKYETVIGDDACKLSEGQKQKITIARALIKKTRILILDEAMSSMDSASEEEITGNIKREQSGLTIISVSHRLSTVMACDLAYFLKKPGEMVIDNPQRLVENDAGFRNLFAAQSTR